jgi:hypothetical protein
MSEAALSVAAVATSLNPWLKRQGFKMLRLQSNPYKFWIEKVLVNQIMRSREDLLPAFLWRL